MAARSIHDVRADAFEYAWDNSVEPALEIESGEAVQLHVRDASDEQIGPGSSATDVLELDFSHINPVSGPVFVKGARPGDTLAVELLEFAPPDWGWTAIIPGFGLLADEFPEPWLRISQVDAEHACVRFSEQITLPYRPFPGTLGVARPEPGQHPILPPSRYGGNMDVKHLNPGVTLYLPVGVEGALFALGDTHAAQGDGEVCGTAIETAMDVVVRLTVRRTSVSRCPSRRAGPARRCPRAVRLPRLHRGRARPAGGRPGRRARDDHVSPRPPGPRPGGGLRARERRLRTCGSTRSWTPRTGSWAHSCPTRSSSSEARGQNRAQVNRPPGGSPVRPSPARAGARGGSSGRCPRRVSSRPCSSTACPG